MTAVVKLLELVNRECVIFHQARLHVSIQIQILLQFDGKFSLINCIHHILHIEIILYSGSYRVL